MDRDLKIHHDKIRDIKNNFDGYEKYLYYEESSYVTSSIGEFPNKSHDQKQEVEHMKVRMSQLVLHTLILQIGMVQYQVKLVRFICSIL